MLCLTSSLTSSTKKPGLPTLKQISFCETQYLWPKLQFSFLSSQRFWCYNWNTRYCTVKNRPNNYIPQARYPHQIQLLPVIINQNTCTHCTCLNWARYRLPQYCLNCISSLRYTVWYFSTRCLLLLSTANTNSTAKINRPQSTYPQVINFQISASKIYKIVLL